MKFSASLFLLLSLVVAQESVVPLDALVEAEPVTDAVVEAVASVEAVDVAPVTEVSATSATADVSTDATEGIASVAAVSPLFAVEPTDAISAVLSSSSSSSVAITTTPAQVSPTVPAWASNSQESQAAAHPTVAPFDPPVQANSAAQVVAGLFIVPLIIALLLV